MKFSERRLRSIEIAARMRRLPVQMLYVAERTGIAASRLYDKIVFTEVEIARIEALLDQLEVAVSA